MSGTGCVAYDYIAIICSIGGLIISEILPHCPGIEANVIVHLFTLAVKKWAESDCNKSKINIKVNGESQGTE